MNVGVVITETMSNTALASMRAARSQSSSEEVASTISNTLSPAPVSVPATPSPSCASTHAPSSMSSPSTSSTQIISTSLVRRLNLQISRFHQLYQQQVTLLQLRQHRHYHQPLQQ